MPKTVRVVFDAKKNKCIQEPCFVIVTNNNPLNAIIFRSGYIRSPQEVCLFTEVLAHEVATKLGLEYCLYHKDDFGKEYAEQFKTDPIFLKINSLDHWNSL